MTMQKQCLLIAAWALLLTMSAAARADVSLPAMFSDHAVLQRGVPVPVWGTADAGEEVHVAIAGQTHRATADGNGKWRVTLEPLSVGEPLTLVVEGKNRVQRDDILVGEVWLCSGQSNMEWPVSQSWNGDLEIAAANQPQIRTITVATRASQTPLADFDGRWEVCSPQTIGSFSAVGYYFGRELNRQLGVPIGLIDNAWGGSACEAWIPREQLAGKAMYEPLLARWDEQVAAATAARDGAARDGAARGEGGRRGRRGRRSRGAPDNVLGSQHRPANLYHGRIAPVMPFAIRGAIWYQGETNAGRAYQYRDMFPLMVETWRDEWGQGDFPFYWVQLADYMAERDQPGDSAWAELREAQTLALERLPHSGQAVIIDLGEASDIHPRNKLEVARRLARIALARDYGREDLVHLSPRYDSMEVQGDRIIVRLKDVGERLRTVDSRDVQGFAIAGEDRAWVWATARIIGPDQVEVRSDAVPEPVAVRYAWADNPVANLYNTAGLPVTPFRTDDWPGVTAEAR